MSGSEKLGGLSGARAVLGDLGGSLDCRWHADGRVCAPASV